MNMMEPERALRAGVVGTGGISKEHLAFLAASPRAELVGVCDVSPAAVAHAAETYGTTAYASVAAMLEGASPDVVHVLTPPTTHIAIAEQCLAAGAHVVCEKPITLDAPSLEGLLATAERAGRRIVENHNYRFNPEVVHIDGLVAAGTLGRVAEVEIRMGLPVNDPGGRFGDPNLPSPIHLLPAGVIHDFITHLVYLLGHFAPGVEWSTVDSRWNAHGGVAHVAVDDLDSILVGADPSGEAVHGRIRFSAQLAPDCFEITVRGTEGYAQVEIFSGRITEVVPRPVGKQLTSIANMMIGGVSLFAAGPRSLKRKIMQQGPYVGLANFLDLTYAALASGAEPPVTAADMLTTSRLIDRLVAGRSRSDAPTGEQVSS
ncbi:MAG: Gfo/Idh/MocA family oxidoreductase [Acidimicrobiales bacterium]